MCGVYAILLSRPLRFICLIERKALHWGVITPLWFKRQLQQKLNREMHVTWTFKIHTCPTAWDLNICLIDRIISCAPLNSQFCLIILDSTSCCYMYMYSKLFNILGFDLTPTLINEREVHYFHDLENLTGHCSMDKNNHALETMPDLYGIQNRSTVQHQVEWNFTGRLNYTLHEVFHGRRTNTSRYHFLWPMYG